MSDAPSRARRSREVLDDLKRRHPIETVAALFTCLGRAGNCLAGLCPLHAEMVPSFYCYLHTQSWFCYGCQQGGDVIDLVRRRLALSFEEALRWLDEAPTSPPLTRSLEASHSHYGVDAALALAARWTPAGQATLATALSVYTLALWKSPDALRYLAYRGITHHVAQQCHLGHCGGTDLMPTLQYRHIPLEAAWQVGLLVGTARQPRERFAGRLVIPELRDTTIAWMTGRLVETAPDVKPAGPKYLSLPGARMLGGVSQMTGHSAIVAVEGPMDWLALVRWGIPGCYLGGSGVPREAVELLSSAQVVYLAFDHDEAGQRATRTLLRHLDGRGRPVRLPPGVKDVAELGQQPDGQDQFRRCLRDAARHQLP